MRYWLTDQKTNDRYADFTADVEIRVGDIVPNRDPYRGEGFWWPEPFNCPSCDGDGVNCITKKACKKCDGEGTVTAKGFHVKMRVLHSRDHVELSWSTDDMIEAYLLTGVVFAVLGVLTIECQGLTPEAQSKYDQYTPLVRVIACLGTVIFIIVLWPVVLGMVIWECCR